MKIQYIDYHDKEREITLERFINNINEDRNGIVEEVKEKVDFLISLNCDLLKILYKAKIIDDNYFEELWKYGLDERKEESKLKIILDD